MLATEYMSMGIWESDIRKEAAKEGYEAGIATGLEQGVYKKSVEDAKAMLADGMDINLVAKYTGLPIETIESIGEIPY
ncbi:MAG: hypothetical protein IKP60_01345 [Treponema sp.]|nr:hypothetical protein [Treponema sp.]